MEYTKGEWKAETEDNGDWVIKAGNILITQTFSNRANAHLIASALDLYEACKGIMPLVIGAFYKTYNTRPEIIALQQALAKAEGK